MPSCALQEDGREEAVVPKVRDQSLFAVALIISHLFPAARHGKIENLPEKTCSYRVNIEFI